MKIKAGSTNVSLPAYMVDSTTGAPETGITIANLDLQYTRLGETPTAKVDATALAATNTAHTDNYAIALDDTDQPGVLRVDWPDAAFATGASRVVCSVTGSGFAPCHTVVELDGVDVTSVNGTATDLEKKPYRRFTVAASPAPTTTSFSVDEAAITALDAGDLDDWTVRWDSDATNAAHSCTVTTHGATGAFTVPTQPFGAPVAGDTGILYKA
jgi:hypothetical protein